jgi:hypothetical protein
VYICPQTTKSWPSRRLLEALQGLDQALAAERGTSSGLPPLAQALARGRGVATHLCSLMAVFDAQRFGDPEADIALDQVGWLEGDAGVEGSRGIHQLDAA